MLLRCAKMEPISLSLAFCFLTTLKLCKVSLTSLVFQGPVCQMMTAEGLVWGNNNLLCNSHTPTSKWSRGSRREEDEWHKKALEYEDICHAQPRLNKNMSVQFAVLDKSVVESIIS